MARPQPSAEYFKLPHSQPFVMHELRNLTIRELELRCDTLGIPRPAQNHRKLPLQRLILNSDENVEPAFTRVFALNDIPEPPLTKVMLKRLPTQILRVICREFGIRWESANTGPHLKSYYRNISTWMVRY